MSPRVMRGESFLTEKTSAPSQWVRPALPMARHCTGARKQAFIKRLKFILDRDWQSRTRAPSSYIGLIAERLDHRIGPYLM
jgi:hypothetical protein